MSNQSVKKIFLCVALFAKLNLAQSALDQKKYAETKKKKSKVKNSLITHQT